MGIAVAQPAPIRVSNIAVGLKGVMAATALYALCVTAPGIYRAHPAIREFERQTAHGDVRCDRILSRLREHHRAVLAEAAAKKTPESRIASLEEEIAMARLELDGYATHLRRSRSNAAPWQGQGFGATGSAGARNVLSSMSLPG